jgi:hypothetical protein
MKLVPLTREDVLKVGDMVYSKWWKDAFLLASSVLDEEGTEIFEYMWCSERPSLRYRVSQKMLFFNSPTSEDYLILKEEK